MTDSILERRVSAARAAQWLGCSTRTVRRWCEGGYLRARFVTPPDGGRGHWAVSVEAIEEILRGSGALVSVVADKQQETGGADRESTSRCVAK